MSVSKMYDEVANRYEDLVTDSRYIGPSWIEKKLQVVNPLFDEYLDLGCATGTIGAVISSIVPNAKIQGLDISSEMIRLAERRGVYEKLDIHNLDESIRPLVTSGVDVVTALGFSEFLQDPQHLLNDISYVLKKGGHCFISFQLYDPSNAKLPRNTYSGSVVHTAYSESEVKNMIQSAGLQLITLDSLCGYVSGKGYECYYLMAEARKT